MTLSVNKKNLIILSSFAALFLGVSGGVSRSYGDEVEGVIRQVIFDTPTGSTTELILLKKDGRTLKLLLNGSKLKKELTSLPFNTNVILSGSLNQGVFKAKMGAWKKIDSIPKRMIKKSSPGSTNRVGNTLDEPYVMETGVRKIAIIPITFANFPTTPTCSPETMLSFFTPMGAINKHFNENLKGKVTFSAVAFAPVEVTHPEYCQTSDGWPPMVLASLNARGEDLSGFFSYMLVVPGGIACTGSWTQLGDGTLTSYKHPIVMSSEACGRPGYVGHELGHNIGWNHANSESAEYGDYSDIMGHGNYVHSNAPHKISANIVAPSEIQDIDSSGIYRVYSLTKDTTAKIKVLRIPLQQERIIRELTYKDLYISYRTPEGMDAEELRASEIDKTYAHLWSGQAYGSTVLAGNAGDNDTFPVLETPITIKQVSHTADYAVVCVQIEGYDCTVPFDPSVPRTILSIEALGEVPYTKWKAIFANPNTSYVKSVKFNLDGYPVDQIDNAPPFLVCGDGGSPSICDFMGNGTHTVTATAYSQNFAQGTPGPVFTQTFTIGGPPLPVTLSAFDATAKNGSIALIWRTTSESNFNRFEVEQSSDATELKVWKKIGEVVGGTKATSNVRSYTYSLNTSVNDVTYYFRLKMIDTNTKSSYSRIVSAKSIASSPVPTRPRKKWYQKLWPF